MFLKTLVKAGLKHMGDANLQVFSYTLPLVPRIQVLLLAMHWYL